MSCPFRLAVINDEITQDFGRACEIASKDFGLNWIELRGMWNKNIVDLDSAEIAEALAARLGIASGRDLAQACRDSYSRPTTIVFVDGSMRVT